MRNFAKSGFRSGCYSHGAAVSSGQLDLVGVLVAEADPVVGPAVLRLHVRFTPAFIAEEDQNAQRFTYLCDALQWLCLKISKMKISRSLAHTSHTLHTSYKI